MIIIGYQGIGKSSLAGRRNEYIDLESSNFNNVYGEKTEGWHIPYCKVAEDLSKQGYRVFVSCHREVQEYLLGSNAHVLLCYPSVQLEEQWLDKLQRRYEQDPSDKNLAALETAKKYYREHIVALGNSSHRYKLVLKDINYTLDNEIDNILYGTDSN